MENKTKRMLTFGKSAEREFHYSRVLFLFVLCLLLVVPLLWFVQQAEKGKLFASLESRISGLVSGNQNSGVATLAFAPEIEKKQDWQAQKVGQSHTAIHVRRGEQVRIWVDFKNVGRKTWVNYGNKDFIAINVKDPIGRHSPFRAADWDKKHDRYYYRPNRMSNRIVPPGGVARFYITLQAPDHTGEWVENFGLVSEWNLWIPGGDLRIPIKIAPIEVRYLYNSNRRGKVVKVGIWETNKAEISSSDLYKIRDGKGRFLAEYHRGELVSVEYRNGKYHLEGPNKQGPRGWRKTVIDGPIVFDPAPRRVMEIVNYESRPSWNPSLNDNRFRGRIPFQHSEKTSRTWVINALQVEAYLRGVAEASNSVPYQMLKTMAVAERTYATYHILYGQRWRDDNFYVDNRFMQVYKGVGYELRNPNMVQAIMGTTGQIVTYKNTLAITPYFSRSDGETKAFHDVWGGPVKPWLVSVQVPWSRGHQMLGHGVGMDAQAGVEMAAEGWKYRDILKYFYKGTSIKRIY